MAAPSKARKRVAPVIVTLVLTALCGGAIAVLLWLAVSRAVPLAAAVIYTVVYIATIGLLVAVLIQRLKEIEKGEEDEAAEY